MSDFSTPHAACTAKHTKYQPSEAEWRCPKCGIGGYSFYIDEPHEDAHPDCPALHDGDVLRCDSATERPCPGMTGRAFAAMLARKANLVPCLHCKGTGFVSGKKSGGAT